MTKVYKHYSGKMYYHRGTAVNHPSGESMTVYESTTSGNTYVRPTHEFEQEIIIDSKVKPRFEFVKDVSW